METRATRSKKRKAPVKATRGRGRKKAAVADTADDSPQPAEVASDETEIVNEPAVAADDEEEEEEIMLDQLLDRMDSNQGENKKADKLSAEAVPEMSEVQEPDVIGKNEDEIMLDQLLDRMDSNQGENKKADKFSAEPVSEMSELQEPVAIVENEEEIMLDQVFHQDDSDQAPLKAKENNSDEVTIDLNPNDAESSTIIDSEVAVDVLKSESCQNSSTGNLADSPKNDESDCDKPVCPFMAKESEVVCPMKSLEKIDEEKIDRSLPETDLEAPPSQPVDDGDVDDAVNSEGDDDYDDYSDFDESDIDEMLEHNFKEDLKGTEKRVELDTSEATAAEGQPASADFETRKKIILIEKRLTHFEVLPEDWIKITHSSGMPVYLHRKLRVCTFSKPYFIGNGSARNHRVPLSSIPCLDYKRSIEEENNQPANNDNGEAVTQARVLTTQENDEVYHLSPDKLREYAQTVFQFKEIQMQTFRSWPARRNFQRQKRAETRNSLPEGSKLIMAPIKDAQSKRKVEWIMNPTGKTYVCIMHDYVQRALKKKPVYSFKEIDNTDTPYMVTILLDDVEYGSGLGSSKKLAKMEAAKKTLDILIPGMKDKVVQDPKMTGRVGERVPTSELEFFDDIPVEDPRIVEYCSKTTEPLPHAILLTCLQRNFGLTETNVSCAMNARSQRKNVFTMTVGKHTVSVDCANKREGKQKASQALLQILHPDVHSWGSLLRMYGNASIKTFNEKKVEEQEITSLQSRSDAKGPNLAILNKLKQEMLKLKINRQTVCPIGEFKPPEDFMIQATPQADG